MIRVVDDDNNLCLIFIYLVHQRQRSKLNRNWKKLQMDKYSTSKSTEIQYIQEYK